MVEIVQVDPREILRVAGINVDLPTFALAGVDDDGAIAVGGLAWNAGRCWLFLKVVRFDPKYRFRLVSCAHRLFRHAKQLGESEVFTPRDSEHKTSEKLLKLLGFSFSYQAGEVEIWRRELG